MISTVLIVDDNKGIIELISSFLKDEGCTPISTHFLQAEQIFSFNHSVCDMLIINCHPAYYENILKLHLQVLSEKPTMPVFVLTNKLEMENPQIESLKNGGCVLIDNSTHIFPTLAKKLHEL